MQATDEHKLLGQDSNGFSLIEALVAVALIAAAFIPMLVLQQRLTQTTIAIERSGNSNLAIKNASIYLANINPSVQRTGEEDLGNARFSWRAEPISAETPALTSSGGPTNFVVQLFQVNTEVILDNGEAYSFSIDLMGWRSVLPPDQLLDPSRIP